MISRPYRAPLAAALLAAVAAASPAAAAPAPRDASQLHNLGDGLLDGLLKDFPAEDPAPGVGRRGGDWLFDEDAIRRRGREAGGGEDVGQSPLEAVIDKMAEAERRIADERTDSEAAPVQRQVVADLEKLIAAMEKQCQGGGGQCDKPSDAQRQASQRSQPKPGGGAKPAGQTPQASQAAARSSTTRRGSAPADDAASAPPGDLMKAAWGHLPERLRERMLQSSSDEFLPEYREELEAYYRRLAEREAEGER